MARYAKTIGMEVAAHDPYVAPEAFRIGGVSSLALEELCRRSDVLTIHADLRSDNVSLIDSDLLDLLPEDAYLINTSRGELMDEKAVAERVRDAKLAGVAVGVLRAEHESLCLADSPLMSAARDGFSVFGHSSHRWMYDRCDHQTEDLLAEVVAEALSP